MLNQLYCNELAKSICIFTAREELRGKDIDDNVLYPISLDSGMLHVDMKVPIKSLKQKVGSVPELIYGNMNPNSSPQISSFEEMMSYLDLSMAERFMRRNFMQGLYSETISCAQRAIDNLEILKQYSLNFDNKGLDEKLRNAHEHKHGAHIVWENPTNSSKLMDMEAALKDGDYKDFQRIEKELQEFEPINLE